ncbi:MAG: tRNA (adenosine(37)-N6)-threonylcarbamoyltransferase complex transferase subunit TsaD [Cytophagales bacterium]|nr:MAG: tRNA (adenosine(37)-N6)-threonylcarbamoyltransferase complex transferase subunit TsaD [Cytophagales bacterium]
MDIVILAIESSCDETAAAVICNGKILSNIVATQEIHIKYGGVVPELASRAHQKNIVSIVNQALDKANITKNELNAVAFTQGPGLLGALLVGVSFAKAFAWGLGIPFIAVNHMQAHILAHFIDEPSPKFPFICLTVSGGHTQLVKVNDHLEMEIIGQTNDDAVGEAFDKTAKILGLSYPGGPLIDKYAQEGNPLAFKFPIVEMPNLDFSFSGIKTAFLYFIKDNIKTNPDFIQENLNDICASIQYTLVQILLKKIRKALKQTGINTIAIAGGVSANKGLRSSLKNTAEIEGWDLYIPKFEYCTDNAAMIAITAHYKYLKKDFATLETTPDPRMQFADILNKN